MGTSVRAGARVPMSAAMHVVNVHTAALPVACANLHDPVARPADELC